MAFDEGATRPYFPVQHVVAKTLEIYQDLLGVRFQEADVETWEEDVRAYAVWDATPSGGEGFLGWCYLDLYPRRDYFLDCVETMR